MASDREGPKAIVVLSCDGCGHRKDWGSTWRPWCGALGEHRTFTDPNVTPDWCPHLPGPLVAVPVPETRNSLRGYLSRGEEAAIERYAARDEGWNACRSEIIQRARALGQEVTDV